MFAKAWVPDCIDIDCKDASWLKIDSDASLLNFVSIVAVERPDIMRLWSL